LIVVSIISLIPGKDIPHKIELIPYFDKYIHAGMYFTLSVFLINPMSVTVKMNSYLVAFICSVVTGGLFEILQITVAQNRSGSWADFAANTTGAALGLLTYRILLNTRYERIFKA
jgi:VanZ family protein